MTTSREVRCYPALVTGRPELLKAFLACPHFVVLTFRAWPS